MSNAVVRRDYWRGDESDSESDSDDDEPEETLRERITENSKRLYNVTSNWSKWGWKKVNYHFYV